MDEAMSTLLNSCEWMEIDEKQRISSMSRIDTWLAE